ncbi:MAG: sodium:solute symporter family protein [Planctomycetota bacterium]|nr:sodium:solute symporter family protein [Planctomycetota bacterium]
MTSSAVVIAIAAIYLGACLVVGMLPGRKSSDSAAGFVAGDRSLGPLVMYFITGATIFSAFAFLGAPGRAYERGAAAFYVLAYGTLGFIPFYWLGPRASRLGKRFGFVTQAEMVAARFGMPSLAGVMALISAAAFVPYLALQMKGAGYVLFEMTNEAVPKWLGAAIVYGLVTIYVLRSGVLGIGWTNTLQGIFMLTLAWAMGIYLPYKLYGGIGPMFERIAEARPELLEPPGLTGSGASWGWGEYSSAVIVSVIGFSVWPHLFMKAFTAKDELTLRRTVVLYPTFQLFIVPILILGFAGVMFSSAPEEADQIVPHIMMNSELPAVVIGLFCAGALAASMSSGDAISHAAASILVRDGWVTAFRRPLDPHFERQAIRVVLVFVMLAAYALALVYKGNLVDLLLYAYGPVVQFAPVVVATLYWSRARGVGVLAGLIVGIVLNTWFVVFPEQRPFAVHAGVYGLTANVLVLIATSLAIGRKETDGEEFLSVAGTKS